MRSNIHIPGPIGMHGHFFDATSFLQSSVRLTIVLQDNFGMSQLHKLWAKSLKVS